MPGHDGAGPENVGFTGYHIVKTSSDQSKRCGYAGQDRHPDTANAGARPLTTTVLWSMDDDGKRFGDELVATLRRSLNLFPDSREQT